MCNDNTMDPNLCLESIEEFVFNEDKVVTYKWLSSKLNVHVNTAKQLLYSFVNQLETNESLLVTYALSGFSKETEGLNITLVKDRDLDKVRNTFKQVISEHIYSVQKSSRNVCLHDLNITDIDNIKPDKKFCSIHIDGNTIRENFAQLNLHTEEPVVTQEGGNAKKNDKKLEATQKSKNDSDKGPREAVKSTENQANNFISKGSPEKSHDVESKTQEKERKKSISPKKEKKKSISPKKEKKPLKKNIPLKGGSIGAFFNKQAALNAEKKKDPKETPKVELENILKNKLDNEKTLETDKKEKVDNEKTLETDKKENKVVKEKKSAPKNTPKGNRKSLKRKKSKEEDNSSQKKRKRIMVASDSESSSEEEMDVDEEPEPLSPEPPPVSKPESDDEVIPPTPTVMNGKKRVRKQIDKTFTDEEGFIITKKEYVYESCSDEEQAVSTEKNALKNQSEEPAKKESPKSKSPQKNKQASITSFFRKK